MFYRILASLIGMLLVQSAFASDQTWIMIDTSSQTLYVKRAKKVIEKFNNISIGRNGVIDAGLRTSGDDRTPLGTFRIAWISQHSRFNLFFGFNYPTKSQAYRAYVEGLIDEPTYDSILSSIRSGKTPSQRTPMGGYLGIHGLGRADHKVHKQFNWTHGCVALNNQQIEKLAHWIRIGTRVVIQ